MLIHDEKENEALSSRYYVLPGALCAWCGKPIRFPCIVTSDPNATVYHPVCAAQLAHALMGDVWAALFAQILDAIALDAFAYFLTFL